MHFSIEDIKNSGIPTGIKQLMNISQVNHYHVLPIASNSIATIVASDKEIDESILLELQLLLDNTVEVEKISSQDFKSILAKEYRSSNNSVSKLSPNQDFLTVVVSEAIRIGSSDIHFEPKEKSCRIRFRIDGKLMEKYIIDAHEYPSIVNKIKIQAGLNISEKRRTQDGRISDKNHKEIDIRVSVLPALHGEKVVMRILQKDRSDVSIHTIGLSDAQKEILLRNIYKQTGIILISGPTGSGKTTTLYGVLQELNEEDVNILTVEDPIEYTIDGVNQVQVKEDIGFSFAAALRSFLRQDPDIIMLGEIRDEETAQMAVKASLTGHLVFSTIHTNSATGIIERLQDMGVPSYLIGATLNLAMAQRLVRKLCSECIEENKESLDIHKPLIKNNNIQSHYSSSGCNHCHYTGFNGRIGIFEFLEIDDNFRQAIKESNSNYKAYIDNSNFKSLKQQAIELVRNGITSIEEIFPLTLD